MNCPKCNVPILYGTKCPKCKYDTLQPDGGSEHIQWLLNKKLESEASIKGKEPEGGNSDNAIISIPIRPRQLLFCPNCGMKLSGGEKFCSGCGIEIPREDYDSMPDRMANGQENIRPENNPQSPQSYSTNAEKTWFYNENGMRYGPLSADEMKEAITSGKIHQNTQVWTEGFQEWKTAGQTVLNEYLGKSVPGIDPSSISDKWVWALATVPILAQMILPRFGIRGYTLTIITIILNCIFLAMDIKYLKQVYTDPGNWMWLGFLLVPVYLFIRAAKTNRHFACPIVYCCLFLAVTVF